MRYRVILADPPWKFKTYSRKGLGRSAEAWYDCMTLAQIKAMDERINRIAEDDCVLFLWVPDPFLEHGMDLIRAWGFKYKTVGFYWVKCTTNRPNSSFNSLVDVTGWPIGTGYWTRANPEQCLLATRGHPKRINGGVRKLVIAPRREHSRKPDEVYEQIEALCPGPYMELFARQRWPGWHSWGNEVDKGINRTRRWSADARELR